MFLYGFLNWQYKINRQHKTMGIKIIDTSSSIFKWFKRLGKEQKRFFGLKKGHLILRGVRLYPTHSLIYATVTYISLIKTLHRHNRFRKYTAKYINFSCRIMSSICFKRFFCLQFLLRFQSGYVCIFYSDFIFWLTGFNSYRGWWQMLQIFGNQPVSDLHIFSFI